MYRSFRVKNFRCFKDLQINDLGRVNLIAGKNNTGKTALMEAMFLLTHPLTPQTLFQLQGARGFPDSEGDRRDSWKQIFYGLNSSTVVVIEGCDTTFEGKRRNLSISEHFSDTDSLGHVGQYLRHAKQIGLIGKGTIDIRGAFFLRFSFALPNSQAERLDVYMPSRQEMPVYTNILFDQSSGFVPAQGRAETQWLADNFTTIDLNGDLPKLIDMLAIFERKLSDLRLQSQSGHLTIWGHLDSHQVPIKLMGEGVNRFANFAIAMIAERPNYLFIDEIENGIHHTVQCKVWKAIGKLARELDIQVFATTHSLEMIRAAYEAFAEDNKLDEFRYHRLSRSRKTGELRATTYNELDMEAVAAFDFDHEVR